jgi:hypothetical protein
LRYKHLLAAMSQTRFRVVSDSKNAPGMCCKRSTRTHYGGWRHIAQHHHKL